MSGDPWEDALADDQDDPWEAALREPEQEYGYDSQGAQPSVLRPQTDPNQTLAHSSSAPRTDQTFFRQPPDASGWDKALEGMQDGGLAAAGGVLSGAGINPQQALGQGVRGALEVANERSPVAAPIGKMAGEIGIQALGTRGLNAAPVAQGLISGALSGRGNADTDDWGEQLNAMEAGGVLGAVGGKVLGGPTGYVSNKLEQKGAEYGEKQAIHGLMNRGSTEAQLGKLEAQRPVREWYDDANRLGIKGSPYEAQPAAQRVVNQNEGIRNSIEARNAGVQVDQGAAAQAVRDANPYPGVPRMERAADRAAQQVQAAGPDFGAQDVQRAYFGKQGNFPRGSSGDVLSQNAHGAVNDSMAQALDAAEPGAGAQWQQAGRDEQTGIQLGANAQQAKFREAGQGWDGGDVWTGGGKRLINNNRHAIAEKGYGALNNVAEAGNFISEWGNGLPAAAAGASAGNITGQSATLADTALDAIAAGGRELGDYRDQFAEAASSPEQGAVANLITKLTMSDPKFRQTTLARLRELGAR